MFRHLVMALSSPFMSFLSETVEHRLGGVRQAQPFTLGRAVRELRRGLHISLRNILRELFYTLLLFLLGLALPVLSPLLPFALFAVQAFYEGFGNMDFTLERH
ncbi:EI24 domain-containing protein, partial [Arthrospira platensis SPKY1]|nr:EI24 domain-containing protein [Arthrospira platensis SPKY1]